MSLVIDNRKGLTGKPALHVLIIGVSSYPFLPPKGQPPTQFSYGMTPLSSTSLSALRIYDWVTANAASCAVPLGTCRVLLSPSNEEKALEARFKDFPTPAKLMEVLQAVQAWREDARLHQDNITLFYFAGHGVQRKPGDAVLLLEEFGNGVGAPLFNAIETNNIHLGMAPTATQRIAGTQLYFIDACRNLPSQFLKFDELQPTQVLPVDLTGQDTRTAPIYFAAIPGSQAKALPAEQTLFSRALIACLTSEAHDCAEIDGVDRWHISTSTLGSALQKRMVALSDDFKAQQQNVTVGKVEDKPIFFFERAPTVRFEIELQPQEAADTMTIEMQTETGLALDLIPKPLRPNPFSFDLPAGYYLIGATPPPDSALPPVQRKVRKVLPPKAEWRRNLSAI